MGAWQPRILDPELVKSVTFAYELRFRRSLYARVAKNMIYNSRLDFIGKFWLYFYLFIFNGPGHEKSVKIP